MVKLSQQILVVSLNSMLLTFFEYSSSGSRLSNVDVCDFFRRDTSKFEASVGVVAR